MSTNQRAFIPDIDRTVGTYPTAAGPGISQSNPTGPFSGVLEQGSHIVAGECNLSSGDPNAAGNIANSFTISAVNAQGQNLGTQTFTGAGHWLYNVTGGPPGWTVTVTPLPGSNYTKLAVTKPLSNRA